MLSNHAKNRGMERIKNKSYSKNKEANIKRIMYRDAYERYFAFDSRLNKIYRYVKKDETVFKYILNKLDKKIITVYPVDFKEEKKRFSSICILGDVDGI